MIQKTVRTDGIEGYEYRMPSSCEFAEVVVKVEAEVGGHGCLFGIEVPKMATKGMCWEGDPKLPEMYDVLKVLNRILQDYHSKCTIVQGSVEKL